VLQGRFAETRPRELHTRISRSNLSTKKQLSKRWSKKKGKVRSSGGGNIVIYYGLRHPWRTLGPVLFKLLEEYSTPAKTGLAVVGEGDYEHSKGVCGNAPLETSSAD
jgi:hypothetical protein